MENDIKPFVENLLQKCFSGESPLEVDNTQVEPLGQQIRQSWDHINDEYVKIDPHRFRRTKDEIFHEVTAFRILAPVGMSFSHEESDLVVVFDNDQLKIVYDNRFMAVVSSLDEIVALVEECQGYSERQHGEMVRQEKIRELKTQATLAYVKKLAEDEIFTFSVISEFYNIDLYVKFGFGKTLKLELPYDKYPDTLELIGPSIRTFYQLYEMEIDFSRGYRSENEVFKWVTPESQEEEELLLEQ